MSLPPSVRVEMHYYGPGTGSPGVNEESIAHHAAWHRRWSMRLAARVCTEAGRPDLAEKILALSTEPPPVPKRPTLPEYVTGVGQARLVEARRSKTGRIFLRGGAIKVGRALAEHGLLRHRGEQTEGHAFDLLPAGAELADLLLAYEHAIEHYAESV